MDFSDYITINKAASLLGVSTSTLRNWDKNGNFIAARHPINGYRIYNLKHLEMIKQNFLEGNIEMQLNLFKENSEVQKEKEENIEIVNFNNFERKKIGPYYINNVINEDCVYGMQHLPDNCIDIAIVDPPYNLSKGGKWNLKNKNKLSGFGGEWKKVMASWDDMPLSEYLSFTISWLTELKRVIKNTGSFWIHGTYHNIGIINFAMQLLNIEIINEVIWYKRNSFPNLSGRRLTASHETIIWAHTGGPKNRKYFFDYEKSKEAFYPEDKIKKVGKQMRTVWDIPNNKAPEELKFGKHPTQKPVRLLSRMLNISAKKNDLLLVPFAGGGSDCIASAKSEINFLAFELDKNYIDLCNLRLNNIWSGTSK